MMDRVVGHENQIRGLRAQQIRFAPRIDLHHDAAAFELHARVHERRDGDLGRRSGGEQRGQKCSDHGHLFRHRLHENEGAPMTNIRRITLLAAAIAIPATLALAQQSPSGPYKVLRTARVGGAGGFDYVYADTNGRRLYIPRTGTDARITVFDLDTLAPAGEIAKTNARGVAVDPKSGHGFSSSRPVAMWDAR